VRNGRSLALGLARPEDADALSHDEALLALRRLVQSPPVGDHFITGELMDITKAVFDDFKWWCSPISPRDPKKEVAKAAKQATKKAANEAKKAVNEAKKAAKQAAKKPASSAKLKKVASGRT
jgi:FKBP-type peptidyl-prolyl cis-trans isomerase